MDYKSFVNDRKKDSSKTGHEEEFKKTAEQYAGKSDAELLGEILKTVNQEKADGTYSDQKLNEFVKNVSPMLNGEQRARLMQAIKMIKGN